MSFSAPIGSAEERASGMIWPGRWVDVTGYDKLYDLGYHTGADLNLNHPHWDANAHADVFAIGDGAVTFAPLFSMQEWGNLVVVDHGVVDGKPLFSRYGHVENIRVSPGETVVTGQPIASVGNGEGLFPYHLHFDISRSDILRAEPGHWPGFKRNLVHAHYVNPQEWLQLNVSDGLANLNRLSAQTYYVVATLGLRVRQEPSLSALQVGVLPFRAKITLEDGEPQTRDGFNWARISGGAFHGDWLAMGRADNRESFVSRFQPG